MPEVAAEQSADEAQVLPVERLIQTPAMPELRDVGAPASAFIATGSPVSRTSPKMMVTRSQRVTTL